MMDFRYRKMGERGEVLSYLRSRREAAPKFGVIDIGATDNPWTEELLLATVDLKANRNDKMLHFQGNINDPDVWKSIIEYVSYWGKFPFSVCSHTLEDIAYPSLTLRMLPMISEAGFIATPSYRRELSRGAESRPWRGYIHHRWMFVEKDGELVLVPKVPFIEHEPFPSDCPEDRTEIQVYWDREINWRVINDDYLGPNVGCVVEMYKDLLK